MTVAEVATACKAELLAQAPRIVQTQAQTALALVTLRVQRDGVTGAHYTNKPVPRFYFKSKAINAGGRDYAKQKGKGTYPGFKQASGLPSDVVTLTFTGRMFRALTAVYSGFTGAVYTARIVASDQEEAQKVGYNMDRYGDFLEPDADEAGQIAEVGQLELQRIVSQYFSQS